MGLLTELSGIYAEIADQSTRELDIRISKRVPSTLSSYVHVHTTEAVLFECDLISSAETSRSSLSER